jgi:excinuclease UvrABC nuclease subunit
MKDPGFPQLVIIDGGKGQLSSEIDAVTELGLDGQMTSGWSCQKRRRAFFQW